MELTITKDELYGLIKKAVRDALKEETLSFILKNVPAVSKEEMEEINKIYSNPSRRRKPAFSETIEI